MTQATTHGTATHQTRPYTVAIYCRVSTSDQKLANQSDILYEYAQRRGWQVHNTYLDIISGSKVERTALNQLMIEARKKLFEGVLVVKLDRLGRSLSHLIHIVTEWKNRGIDLICYDQDIDTTTPHGKVLFYVLGAMAEMERDLIRDRVKAGIERRRREGKHVGRNTVSEYHKKEVLRLYKELKVIKAVSKQVSISYGACWNIIKQAEAKEAGK